MTTSNDQPITDQVRFTIWPTTDTSGIVTDTDDALYYLLPTLGPTATLVLHRVARHLRYTPDVTFDTAELAAQFGVGPQQLRSSLRRLEMFGAIRSSGDRYDVRPAKQLTRKMREHLPASLQAECPYEAK